MRSKPKRSKMCPWMLASVRILRDGGWHTLRELYVAAGHLIPINQAGRVYVRKSHGYYDGATLQERDQIESKRRARLAEHGDDAIMKAKLWIMRDSIVKMGIEMEGTGLETRMRVPADHRFMIPEGMTPSSHRLMKLLESRNGEAISVEEIAASLSIGIRTARTMLWGLRDQRPDLNIETVQSSSYSGYRLRGPSLPARVASRGACTTTPGMVDSQQNKPEREVAART